MIAPPPPTLHDLAKRHRSWMLLLLAAALPWLVPLSEWLWFSSMKVPALGTMSMIGTLPVLAAVALSPLLIGLLFWSRWRSLSLLAIALGMVAVTSSFYAVTASGKIRKDALLKLEQRSEPLVAAIQAYERAVGSPPASLDKLVPTYLPSVPGTGCGAYPEYRYLVGQGAERYLETPWVLTVPTPRGFAGFDEFMYLPAQNYPPRGLGGTLERIGAWAYLHE